MEAYKDYWYEIGEQGVIVYALRVEELEGNKRN